MQRRVPSTYLPCREQRYRARQRLLFDYQSPRQCHMCCRQNGAAALRAFRPTFCIGLYAHHVGTRRVGCEGLGEEVDGWDAQELNAGVLGGVASAQVLGNRSMARDAPAYTTMPLTPLTFTRCGIHALMRPAWHPRPGASDTPARASACSSPAIFPQSPRVARQRASAVGGSVGA